MKQRILERITELGVLAVIRAPSPETALRAVDALVAGGITGIEITYSTPDVPAVLDEIANRHGESVLLGAGTLLEPRQATEAAARSSFLVTPGFDDDLVSAALATGRVTIAGALSPSEVMRATRAGVDIVKLFPASLGGPAYLRALRGPFPAVAFMPTGGVSVDNVDAWLGAGAVAVAAGGDVCSPDVIAAGRFDLITEAASRLSKTVARARARSS